VGVILEASSSAAPVSATTTFVNLQPGGQTQSPDVLVSANASLRFRFVPR